MMISTTITMLMIGQLSVSSTEFECKLTIKNLNSKDTSKVVYVQADSERKKCFVGSESTMILKRDYIQIDAYRTNERLILKFDPDERESTVVAQKIALAICPLLPVEEASWKPLCWPILSGTDSFPNVGASSKGTLVRVDQFVTYGSKSGKSSWTIYADGRIPYPLAWGFASKDMRYNVFLTMIQDDRVAERIAKLESMNAGWGPKRIYQGQISAEGVAIDGLSLSEAFSLIERYYAVNLK